MEVTNVLGESLPVAKFYPDGSFNCPHCDYPVRADEGLDLRKHNPWCFAHPDYPAETARIKRAEQTAREQEQAERRRNHERAMQRVAKRKETAAAERAAKLEQAKAAGICIPCLIHSDFRKSVKHRKACPLAK